MGAGKEAGLSIEVSRSVVKAEQDLADAFTEDGVLPGRADFAKFVDRRFVDDIQQQ